MNERLTEGFFRIITPASMQIIKRRHQLSVEVIEKKDLSPGEKFISTVELLTNALMFLSSIVVANEVGVSPLLGMTLAFPLMILGKKGLVDGGFAFRDLLVKRRKNKKS